MLFSLPLLLLSSSLAIILFPLHHSCYCFVCVFSFVVAIVGCAGVGVDVIMFVLAGVDVVGVVLCLGVGGGGHTRITIQYFGYVLRPSASSS